MTDRIEKNILLRAPRSRVWRALVDRTEFGEWFRVHLPPGEFTPGEEASGHITYPGYEHLVMRVVVHSVEPQRLLSFRWHPAAVDAKVDSSREPTTLVSFVLSDGDGGTLLSVVESGFDKLPRSRREKAWRQNDSGWSEQMKNIERHVGRANGPVSISKRTVEK